MKPRLDPQDVRFPPACFTLLPLLGQYFGEGGVESIRQKPKVFIPHAQRRDTEDFENRATKSRFCLSSINLVTAQRLSVLRL